MGKENLVVILAKKKLGEIRETVDDPSVLIDDPRKIKARISLITYEEEVAANGTNFESTYGYLSKVWGELPLYKFIAQFFGVEKKDIDTAGELGKRIYKIINYRE